MKRYWLARLAGFLLLALSACSPLTQESETAIPPTQTAHPPTQTTDPPTSTIPSLPGITLEKGDFYFSVDGRQSFLYSRNPSGYLTNQYKALFALSSTGGSRLVRLHLDNFGMGYTNTGGVDEAWVKN